MDEEFERLQPIIIKTMRQLLGKAANTSSHTEPESGSHEPVSSRKEQVPEGSTEAAEPKIAEKQLDAGLNQEISYLRENRTEIKTEV